MVYWLWEHMTARGRRFQELVVWYMQADFDLETARRMAAEEIEEMYKR